MTKKTKIKTNVIEVLEHYYLLENSSKRYVLFRGSTRSGKTIAIIQNLITKMINNPGISIVVGVETLSNAKGSVVTDLDEWIEIFGLYHKFKINKADFVYTYIPNGSTLRIVPCDKESKWFGKKADIFWFNEATHIDYRIFEQAQMRLPDRYDFLNQIILDFNPTNPFSWVRDLETSSPPGGVDTFVSTYKDNPFLGKLQIDTIESWKDTNYNKWLVFAQGEYGEVRGAIYTNWEMVDEFPEDIEKVWYGLDFGFTNDPTTLIKVGVQNGEIYAQELLYERGLTNPDIAERIKEMGIKTEVICDSAEPKSIEELRRSGVRAVGVKKGKNSIVQGIDILQRYKINIVKGSNNLMDELINYTWKENRSKGIFINEPNSGWDHLLDALRYVAFTKLDIKPKSSGIILKTI